MATYGAVNKAHFDMIRGQPPRVIGGSPVNLRPFGPADIYANRRRFPVVAELWSIAEGPVKWTVIVSLIVSGLLKRARNARYVQGKYTRRPGDQY
jgi:hypothetical protein